ncbi:MAG: MerR family transcriptional regulator [Dehalococcoidales bacterium]|nr:MerR family transcriptional regulator [Dehalococcoidales bacterium]
MFKIGDFSRLSFVTVKTLHYYDEIGLLKPVKVDRFTGYRYYSADQLPRLNYIVSLKNLGLSLDEVGTLINNSLTPRQMRDLFILKKAELQQRLSEEQRRLEQVEKLLNQIEKEGKMPEYQVVIKELPSMKVASVRGTVPTYGDIPILWDKICPVFEKHMSIITGPPLAIYHDMEYREKDVDIEVAIPISTTIPLPDPIKVRDLPAEAKVASMIHRGPYEKLHEAYQAMMAWCEANGYELAGPDREVYLTGPNDTQDPVDYLTELQQPVKKV